jgi:hypothetical protein
MPFPKEQTHGPGYYELGPFMKELGDKPDPCEPERAYTPSTLGSRRKLLEPAAKDAIAAAVKDEPADRIECKQRSRTRSACMPENC